MQQGRLVVGVDFGTEATDVHINHVGLRIEMIIPNGFQHHRARHDLTGMTHEVFEQAILAWKQRYSDTVPRRFVFHQIKFEVADL